PFPRGNTPSMPNGAASRCCGRRGTWRITIVFVISFWRRTPNSNRRHERTINAKNNGEKDRYRAVCKCCCHHCWIIQSAVFSAMGHCPGDYSRRCECDQRSEIEVPDRDDS